MPKHTREIIIDWYQPGAVRLQDFFNTIKNYLGDRVVSGVATPAERRWYAQLQVDLDRKGK